MAIYTWVDGLTSFVYSFDDTLPSIKDRIRSLVGDKNGVPVAYLSDNEITGIASANGNDLYRSAAECAEACASRVLSIHAEVQQGTRFRVRNFDPDKAYKTFMQLADMLRDKGLANDQPVYGSVSGRIRPPCDRDHDQDRQRLVISDPAVY